MSLYDFCGQVPREIMFEGHVVFERFFQKIVKILKNFVHQRMPLHPLPGLLACRPWQASWVLVWKQDTAHAMDTSCNQSAVA